MRPKNGTRVDLYARLINLVLVTGGVLLWEWAGRGDKKVKFFFSIPTEIVARLSEWFTGGQIWTHIGATLWETFLGFTGGVLVGLLLAFLCYSSQLFEKVAMPYLSSLNAMPRLIFGPIFVLWFGLGVGSKVALSMTIVVLIVFFNTYTGLKEVDRNLINKVRLLGGSQFDVMKHVLIPSALSWVFTSLRTSVGFALVGAVVGEYMGSDRGLGNLIQYAQNMFDAAGVFAGLIILSVTVIGINKALERVEARFSAWRP